MRWMNNMRSFNACLRGVLVLALLPLLSACQDKRMVVTPEPGLLVDLHDCSMHSYQQVKDLKESDLLGRFAYRDDQGWRYDAETTPPSEPKVPAKAANKE